MFFCSKDNASAKASKSQKKLVQVVPQPRERKPSYQGVRTEKKKSATPADKTSQQPSSSKGPQCKGL